MVSFKTVKTGDLLYEATKDKWGNLDSYTVRVIEINHEENWAIASWNGNKPRKVSPKYIGKLRRSANHKQRFADL